MQSLHLQRQTDEQVVSLAAHVSEKERTVENYRRVYGLEGTIDPELGE